MKKIVIIAVVAILVVLGIGLIVNQVPPEEEVITVDMIGQDGEPRGEIRLSETDAGVLLLLDLENIPAGEHGFHIHETGVCDTSEEFTTAGGHYNPTGAQHGMKAPEGSHAGDMPNIVVGEDGTLNTRVLNQKVTLADPNENTTDLATLFDEDGSSIMIHADADDHVSQPSGAAGPRIACGVVSR